VTLRHLLDYTNKYLANPLTREHCKFEQWPQHSAKEQMELMLKTSDELVELHKDPKDLITFQLSEAVFESCGIVMLNESANPQSPVAWINHDLVAKVQAQL
jgi:hypothetical protein